jgi:hypothetical protein
VVVEYLRASPFLEIFRLEEIEAKKRKTGGIVFLRQVSGIYINFLMLRPRDVLGTDVWAGARGGCMIGDLIY